MTATRSAPRRCPVCGGDLAVTRLGCDECGTELSGHFAACDFCGLGAEDREILRVFLASRGNLKEVERHLAVSYPTARARFDTLLGKLGIATERAAPPDDSDVLEELAAGAIDVDEAMRRLS